MLKILICGATGFIGRNLLNYFSTNPDYHVFAIHNNRKPFDVEKQSSNRQDLEELYHRNGLIYIFKKENLFNYKNFYGKKILPLVLSKKYSINIDSYFDYEIAKLYYEKKNN